MMISTLQELLPFAHNQAEAERALAIDQLHFATAFYTAEHVVDSLLSRMDWPRDARRLVDTSAGDGIFLGRALTKLLQSCDPSNDVILHTIEGWEIHPHAVAQARARISAILVNSGRSLFVAQSMANHMVHHADFLVDGPTVPTYDVIIGNPPYLRWLHVPKLLRDDYLHHVPDYACADLLHSFLDRSASVLQANGEIGIVVADRWLYSQQAARLRSRLGADLSIKHLAREDSSSAFYRPKNRRYGTPPRVHPVSVHLSRTASGVALTKEAIYPGADTAKYIHLPTLGQLASVRMGPWLGAPGIFLITAVEAAASNIPAELLVPTVDVEDIINGQLQPTTRYAIKTNPAISPCAEVALHLSKNMHRMAKRGLKGRAWTPPESFHHMKLSQPCLMIPRIAQTAASVRVPAGNLVINHHLSIFCENSELMSRIEQALVGEVATSWLQSHATPLENGYYALSAPLLRRIPLDLREP